MEKNILIITDNEGSNIIRTLVKHKVFPIIRRTIPSAIQVLRHIKVSAIIVEDEHKSVDTLELILNVRDLNNKTPIYISNRYQEHSVIKKIKQMGQIIIFDETDSNFNKNLKKLIAN